MMEQVVRQAGGRIVDAADEDALFAADAGITDVVLAIAETGSIVIRVGDTVGRKAWLVPPVHIAMVRASQVVPDLIDAMERCRFGSDSSATVIITGPSKTADIEGVLVTGVHGPGAVHILLLDDPDSD